MHEFKRILAAADLSECSAAALTYAERFAEQVGAELTLVHANAIAPLIEGVPANLTLAAEYQLEGSRTAVNAFAARYLKDPSSVRKLVTTGAAAETILSTARVLDCDLIVMGTRGASGLTRLLLGSIAESVMREGDRAVLAIRCNIPDPEHREHLFRRILVPVDHSARSKEPLHRAAALASAFDAELIVVNVVSEKGPSLVDLGAETERLRAWLGVNGKGAAKLLTSSGNAAEQVLSYATENAVDLLVVGAWPASAATQTVLGSTAETLTRHASCPVLIVPVD